MPDGLLVEVGRRYARGSVDAAEPLAGGYANDVLSIRANVRTLVLRIKYPPIDPARIRWEHDILRLLAERVAEIPGPVAARDGTTLFRHGRFAVRLLLDLRVTELAASGRALTTGVVHGDVFPGDVLVDDGRATGLLDWEEANVDWDEQRANLVAAEGLR